MRQKEVTKKLAARDRWERNSNRHTSFSETHPLSLFFSLLYTLSKESACSQNNPCSWCIPLAWVQWDLDQAKDLHWHRWGCWKGASLECSFPSACIMASGCALPVGSCEPMPSKGKSGYPTSSVLSAGDPAPVPPGLIPCHCTKQSLVPETSVFEFLCHSLVFFPLFYLLFFSYFLLLFVS